ncbi:MAG TPA: VanZ family protein [Pyrinomonadaceae bacterium]|nr:VanZ family protein [Pyrinomonadaceae bacterium]
MSLKASFRKGEQQAAASLYYFKTMTWQAQSASRRLWRYAPLILWLLVISFASTAEFSAVNTSTVLRPLLLWFFPNLGEGQLALIHLLLRKAGHFSEFAVLALLARRAFITSSQTLLKRHWFFMATALIISYALLDEFHQSFVPSRTSSIYDSGIDIAGGLTVLLFFKVMFRNRAREPNNNG